MTGMHHWNIKTAPFIDTDTESNSLGGDCEHGGIVADENDPASWGHGCLDNTYNVGNGETVEQRPHGKVLKSSRRGGELIA